VRSSDAAAITGVPGAVLRVGGIPALDADYGSVVKERLPSVVLYVVLGSLLALLIGYVPYLRLSKQFCSICSLSALHSASLVLVFSGRPRQQTLGLDGPTGSVYPIVPILSFAIVSD